jgi:hypothetical protein
MLTTLAVVAVHHHEENALSQASLSSSSGLAGEAQLQIIGSPSQSRSDAAVRSGQTLAEQAQKTGS